MKRVCKISTISEKEINRISKISAIRKLSDINRISKISAISN